jgi:tetratricopeptide (TPR) repeat protein
VPSRSFFFGGIAVALVGWASLAAQAKPSQPTLADIETRARQDSNDANAHYVLALRYWDLSRYDEAEHELSQAIVVDPHDAQAFFALSYLPYARRPKLWKEELKGKVPPEWRAAVDSAEHMSRKAVILDPFVDFRVAGTQPPPEGMYVISDYGAYTTSFLVWLGIDAFAYERYELSYAALQLFVDRSYKGQPIDSLPDYLLWYRGLDAAHLSSWPDAIVNFQALLGRGLKREQTDSLIQIPLGTNDVRYILALVEQRAGRPADAMNLLKETIATDLGLYMAHVHLADLYEQYQMWNEAVAERHRAIEANPDDPTLVRDLGVTLLRAGRAADAEPVLHQAVDANPRDPGAPYVLGMVEQQLNKPADARAALTRFLALAPSKDRRIPDAKDRLTKLP